MAGINFVRRWVMGQMKKTSDDGIMITLPDKNKVDLNLMNELFEFTKKNKIDYLKINKFKRKLKNLSNLNSVIEFGRIPCEDIYPLPLQASIWNKNFFLRTLKFNLNPWEYEKQIKNHIELSNYKIFSIHNINIIDYYERGLVVKGKIVKKELNFLIKNNYFLDSKMNTESFFSLFYRENVILNLLRKIKQYLKI